MGFLNFKRERQNDLFPFEKQNVPNKPACRFIWHIRVHAAINFKAKDWELKKETTFAFGYFTTISGHFFNKSHVFPENGGISPQVRNDLILFRFWTSYVSTFVTIMCHNDELSWTMS